MHTGVKKKKNKPKSPDIKNVSLRFMTRCDVLIFLLFITEGCRGLGPYSQKCCLPSLQLLRVELSRLQVLCFKPIEERVREVIEVGEEGERERVGVVGEEVEEEEVVGGGGEDDWLLGRGKEEARCSRKQEEEEEEEAEEAGHGQVAHCCRVTGRVGVRAGGVQGSTGSNKMTGWVRLAAGTSSVVEGSTACAVNRPQREELFLLLEELLSSPADTFILVCECGRAAALHLMHSEPPAKRQPPRKGLHNPPPHAQHLSLACFTARSNKRPNGKWK
ncbi:hypothetical protein D9C73_025615 [Collichthys lucidus]|uniref:Uncharacterized protein n=1 Tax=Collichthys lucidus TaxID=240159 RepID=A0A4U5VTZ4_COLLU|nr:hypothetical protein D9C73_025615 [Collichthys lucidus]